MEPKNFLRIALLCLAGLALPVAGAAGELPLGADVEGLLEYARGNPEYAAMRYEADAAAQRVYPAGAFPDPLFRMELQNITNAGSDAPAEPVAQQGRQHQVHGGAAAPVLGQAGSKAGSGRGRCRAGAGPRGGDLVRTRGERQDKLRPVLPGRPQRAAHPRDPGPARPARENRAGALRKRAGAAAGRDPRPGRAHDHARGTADARERAGRTASHLERPARAQVVGAARRARAAASRSCPR